MALFFRAPAPIMAFMNEDFGQAGRDVAPAVLNEEGPWGNGDDPRRGKGDGGGPRNPWTQPARRRPGGKGGQPSLEELIRRSRQRIAGWGGGPGNLPGRRPIWGYALAAFVILWLVTTSVHRIDPQQRGVVTRLGRYAGTLEPGLAVTLPAPVDVVTRVNVDAIRSIDVPASGGANLLLTRDDNLVDVGYTVRWSVRDPELYLFNVSGNADDLIREAAASTMRGAIGAVTLDQATGGAQAAIEAQVAERLQHLLDGYRSGLVVEGVSIRHAQPPEQVADAFKDVVAARAAADATVADAKRDAGDAVSNAQAQATAFDKVYQAYRLAPEVTRSRMYYDTMEAVLSKTDKVIASGANVTVTMPPPAKKPADGSDAQQPAATAPQDQPASQGDGK